MEKGVDDLSENDLFDLSGRKEMVMGISEEREEKLEEREMAQEEGEEERGGEKKNEED